ncbi:MAG TPA: hypothetical protein V6D34_05780, partial [Candidatus Sericytochromatia bacterium]
IPDAKKRIIEYYGTGLKHYRDRKFPLAMGAFGMVLEIDKDDKSANLHLERCQYWLKNPPPEEWDGSWIMTEK